MKLSKDEANDLKKMVSAIICLLLTIIVVTILAGYKSSKDLTKKQRTLLSLLSSVITLSGLVIASLLEYKIGYYECPKCEAHFVPSFCQYLLGIHTVTKRRLPCPECGKKSMCQHMY